MGPICEDGSRQRPPTQENWWYLRTAAILRKVARNGPVGVTHLAQAFGGKKDNGAMPNTPGVASRHIIRTALQQLEKAGLVEKVETKEIDTEDGKVKLYAGRRITAAGQNWLTTSLTRFVKKPKPSTPVWTSIESGMCESVYDDGQP